MHSRPDITAQWRQAPVTISILAISAVVYALMSLFGDAIILDWLAFNKVEFNGRRFELVSPGSEYWRYVTPALIHFGLLHILFNGLWIWEFGSRLELRLGSTDQDNAHSLLCQRHGVGLTDTVYNKKKEKGEISSTNPNPVVHRVVHRVHRVHRVRDRVHLLEREL